MRCRESTWESLLLMTFEWKKWAVVSERKLVWDILRNWNQQTWLFLFQTDFDTDGENSKEQICPTKEIEWGRLKLWPLSNWDDSWDPPVNGLLFIDPILCINKQSSLWRNNRDGGKKNPLISKWGDDSCCLQFVPSPRCPWAMDNKCSMEWKNPKKNSRIYKMVAS